MAGKSLEDMSAEEIAGLADMQNQLMNDPATRGTMLRLMKAKNPSLSIPEVELIDQANVAFGKVNERLDKFEMSQLERDTKARIERERARLASQGMSEDDINAIEKIMQDEQIPNYATAAKYYQQSRQLAAPTPSTETERNGRFELPADPLKAAKGGRNGLKEFGRSEANAAMNDLLAGRIKLH